MGQADLDSLVLGATTSSPSSGAIHLHPRDAEGRERLDPGFVDCVATTVRDACGVPVGVSTGASIARHRAPDRAGARLDGARLRVGQPLRGGGARGGPGAARRGRRDRGGGVDRRRGAAAGRVGYARRHHARPAIERVDLKAHEAVAFVDAIHDVLDRAGVAAPRLQHGDGDATWILIEDAARRGLRRAGGAGHHPRPRQLAHRGVTRRSSAPRVVFAARATRGSRTAVRPPPDGAAGVPGTSVPLYRPARVDLRELRPRRTARGRRAAERGRVSPGSGYRRSPPRAPAAEGLAGVVLLVSPSDTITPNPNARREVRSASRRSRPESWIEKKERAVISAALRSIRLRNTSIQALSGVSAR